MCKKKSRSYRERHLLSTMSVTDGFFRALMSARNYSGPKTFRGAKSSTKKRSTNTRRCVATVSARVVGGRRMAAHRCKLGCRAGGKLCPCHAK